MKKMLCIATLLMTASIASGQAIENPLLPVETKGKEINGLTWTVSMAREFTTVDALMVTAQLFNTSKERLTFHTDPKTDIPVIVLTRAGKKSVTIPLTAKDGFANRSGNYQPNPGEIARGFSVDLRLFVGKLSPGDYTLKVVYPNNAYRLKDVPGAMALDIPSAEIAFSVSEGSLAHASKATPRNGKITIRKDKAGKNQFIISNHSTKTIGFPAYTWGHKKGEPLSVIFNVEKWNPKSNWCFVEPFGWCGTGLGTYKLPPGESVTVRTFLSQRDGIYRFVVNYRNVLEETSALQQLYSEPILVDDFAREHLKGQNGK